MSAAIDVPGQARPGDGKFDVRLMFRLLAALGPARVALAVSGRSVRVLMYHGVCAGKEPEAPGGGHGKHVAREVFERQMAWIHRHARPISLDELVARLAQQRPLPRRGIVVTFDDGYLNNHLHAWPVLRAYGIPATIYITTSFIEGRALWADRLDAALEGIKDNAIRISVSDEDETLPFATPEERETTARVLRQRCKRLHGRRREELVRAVTAHASRDLDDEPLRNRPADVLPLDFRQLRSMPEHGLTTGSHTVNHEILTRCPADVLARELSDSKKLLETWSGGPVIHFAYPNGRPGDFDERTEAALRSTGYRSAVINVPGVVRAGDSPWRLPRIPVNGGEGLPEFLVGLAGIRPALIRIRALMRRDRRYPRDGEAPG